MPVVPMPVPEECEGFVLAHWNKDFLCYCFAHGQGDPLAMISLDHTTWPNDPMYRFKRWYVVQWADYMAIHEPEWQAWDLGYRKHYRLMHDRAFSDWLWARYAQSHVEAAGLLS